MYYYIYDSFLNTKKYQKQLERIEMRLADLGIRGKTRRLTILHHQRDVVEECVRNGAKTIVFVGNNRSIALAIDTLAKHDVAVGLIPMGDANDNGIARSLGIPPGELACDVLSRRTIARLDLGKIGIHNFLTSAEATVATFACKGPRNAFVIRPTTARATLTIVNLEQQYAGAMPVTKSNPRDGILECVITDATSSLRESFGLRSKIKKTPSVFPVVELHIEEPVGGQITLDNCRSVKLPAVVTVAPQKLRVIVGRERRFA